MSLRARVEQWRRQNQPQALPLAPQRTEVDIDSKSVSGSDDESELGPAGLPEETRSRSRSRASSKASASSPEPPTGLESGRQVVAPGSQASAARSAGSSGPGRSAQPSFLVRKLIASTSSPESPAVASVAGSSERPIFPSIAWWTRPLLDAVSWIWDRRISGGLARRFAVEEACAGVGTGSLSGIAMGVPLSDARVYSDKKEHCRRFLTEKLKSLNGGHIGKSHVFQSMSDHARGEGFCDLHGGICQLPDEQVADCLIMGPPCQAFTSQHGQRAQGCEVHPACNTVMGDGDDTVLQLLQRRRPHSFILENVMNFIKVDPVSGLVPVNVFMSKLAELVVDGDGAALYNGIHIFQLDACSWVTVSRPRSLHMFGSHCS